MCSLVIIADILNKVASPIHMWPKKQNSLEAMIRLYREGARACCRKEAGELMLCSG